MSLLKVWESLKLQINFTKAKSCGLVSFLLRPTIVRGSKGYFSNLILILCFDHTFLPPISQGNHVVFFLRVATPAANS